MNSPSESLLIGIVSGILTSALIYVIVLAFEKILLPWYQAIVYRGVDINGEWEWKGPGSNQTAIFILEQKANKILGVATFVRDDESSDVETIRTFSLSGEISERFVTFVLKHKDRKRLGISSYVLQIVGDGRKMQGYASGYNVSGSNIISVECELIRKEK